MIKAQALMFLRSHFHKELKMQNLMIMDPKELWDDLKLCLDYLHDEQFQRCRQDGKPFANFYWIQLSSMDFLAFIAALMPICTKIVVPSRMLEIPTEDTNSTWFKKLTLLGEMTLVLSLPPVSP
ncbi:hypothetical protein ACLB2K_014188 [Fragaria x ananassa]